MPGAEVSAEEKIRFTIAEYCHLTDTGDYEAWARLFAEEGCFRMAGSEVRGRQALRRFIEQDQPPHRRGLHLTTDSAIRFVNSGAEVRSNFLFAAGGDEAGVLVTAGGGRGRAGRSRAGRGPGGLAGRCAARAPELVLPVARQRWGAEAPPTDPGSI